jgi:polyhydroxyalkanoate synthesis regulator phasin
MVVEAVQTYVNLVNGLTRATRERARSRAHELLAQVGLDEVATDAEQRVAQLSEDVLAASRANRELLEKLVAGEVTKAATRLGFVRSDDLDELREEIAELRAQLARQQTSSRQGATTGKPPAGKTPAKKAPGTKAAARATAGAQEEPGPAQKLAASRLSGTTTSARAPRARRAPSAATPAAPPTPTTVPDPSADAGA